MFEVDQLQRYRPQRKPIVQPKVAMDTSKNDINSLIPPPPPPNPLPNALNLREKDGSTQQNILSSLQSPLPDMLNLSLPEFEEQLVLTNENQEGK